MYRNTHRLLLTFSIFSLLCAAAGCGVAQSHAPLPAPDGLEVPRHADSADIVRHTGYTASYNHLTLLPDWVAYELTADEAGGQCELPRNFSRDPSVRFPKASREDYSRSGWDKGHMAARADMKWSTQALEESDYFTNICPQNHALNAGLWNHLERLARQAALRYGRVYIVTGPLFTSSSHRTIGPAAVHVPDSFFKALLAPTDTGYTAIAFLVPNDSCRGRALDYALTIDSLEALLSLDLFPLLPSEAAEATFQWEAWRPRKNATRNR